jgi:hypothetical protein
MTPLCDVTPFWEFILYLSNPIFTIHLRVSQGSETGFREGHAR